MSFTLTSILKAEWLEDIELISGNQRDDIRKFLSNGQYAPHDPFLPGSVVLYYSDEQAVTAAYASEINRFAAASFESIQGIQPDSKLPKSLSWSLIRLYYAAFFAAHALIRLHGRSLTQIDSASSNRVNQLAGLYGNINGAPLSTGLKRVSIDQSRRRVEITSANGQSHEALWFDFSSVFRPVAERILQNATTSEIQDFSLKIIDMFDILSDEGRMPNFNWLSFMRNSINYRQEYSVWHPYGNQPRYYGDLQSHMQRWKQHPNDLNLMAGDARELKRMVESCVFIVSLCNQCCKEISMLSPNKTSFLKYRAMNLIQLIS